MRRASKPGNLLEDDRAAIALQGDDVLLVLLGRDRAHRVAEFARSCSSRR